MKRFSTLKLFIVFSLSAALFALSGVAYAEAFTLNYSLTEGGSRLQFEKSFLHKGVTVSVTTDAGVRYEVMHKITMPLVNRDNPGVTIQENFVVRGLRGTNVYGDLRAPVTDSPVAANDRIYISNTVGQADSFTVVYGINNPQDLPAGHYEGQIAFVLRSIGASKQEVTKYLNISVDLGSIDEPQGSEASVNISTPTGASTLLLAATDEKKSGYLQVKIKGGFRHLFNINQYICQPFASSEGKALDLSLVSFRVEEAERGVCIKNFTPLKMGLQNIYTSEPSGSSDSDFVIFYQLGDVSGEQAGTYRLRLQYFLEGQGAQKTIRDIELEARIDEVFDLSVEPAEEGQLEPFNFRSIKPGDPVKKREIIVRVNTNKGRPYQVIQNVEGELMEPGGSRVPNKYFTFYTEKIDKDTAGTLRFAAKEPVTKGQQILFDSPSGAPAVFKLIYELDVPKDPKDLIAGDYSTTVSYSLVEK